MVDYLTTGERLELGQHEAALVDPIKGTIPWATSDQAIKEYRDASDCRIVINDYTATSTDDFLVKRMDPVLSR